MISKIITLLTQVFKEWQDARKRKKANRIADRHERAVKRKLRQEARAKRRGHRPHKTRNLP